MLEKSTDELQNVQGQALDSSIYNERGWMVWQELKDRPRPSNRQYQLSLARLKALMLNKDEYKTIKNVTLPAEGGTTQIDHQIVSEYFENNTHSGRHS